MKLYVMRHGPAEDAAPSGLDGDRALTDAGRKRVRGVAKALLDFDEAPVHVISSPLVRAVQTAEIVAVAAIASDRACAIEIRRDLAPGGDGVELARTMAAEGRRRVMLVGHEPDLSGLVSALLGGFDRAFEKAMVVGLHLRSGEGGGPAGARPRLRFVLNPRALRLDPNARGPRGAGN